LIFNLCPIHIFIGNALGGACFDPIDCSFYAIGFGSNNIFSLALQLMIKAPLVRLRLTKAVWQKPWVFLFFTPYIKFMCLRILQPHTIVDFHPIFLTKKSRYSCIFFFWMAHGTLVWPSVNDNVNMLLIKIDNKRRDKFWFTYCSLHVWIKYT
jgi:hypothetical protein